jgi:uncharacterized protein (DUF1015 family)
MPTSTCYIACRRPLQVFRWSFPPVTTPCFRVTFLMVSLAPVPLALVPVDSAAAAEISAPNYDEFQGDREVFDLLSTRPHCVLKVTMAHCDVPVFDQRLEDGGPEALEQATASMRKLECSPRVRTVENLLWVYEVVSPRRPDVRQLGLGGLARTDEIRTERNSSGVIVRNEGIRPEKAEGRARLIEATNAYIGTVNCAVRDRSGTLINALQAVADRRTPDFSTQDEAGNMHRVWLVLETAPRQHLLRCFAAESAAYVADGNHRSAAAAQLGKEHFLAVFFPSDRLRLEPYNRLVDAGGIPSGELLRQLESRFEVQVLGPLPAYRPDQIHDYGLYVDNNWYRLVPSPGTFNADDAAESIDADIIQRNLFDRILGITDPRDHRLNFVGGNKDSAYLKARVDSGEYDFALSLAPVTMQQFVAVCEHNQFMPPKSTWFDPKIRSGLVMALLS